MAWLRIDDRFTANAKIAALTDPEFRVWIRLLCYCAASQRPVVDESPRSEVAGLSSRRIDRFLELDLLHHDEDGLVVVHDWDKFNPPKDRTRAERAKRYRKRRSSRVTSRVTQPVTNPVTSRDTSRTESRPENASLTRGHARTSPLTPVSSKKPLETRQRDKLWDTLTAHLGEPQTETERGRRNKALKELRAIDATQEQLEQRIAAYKRQWPKVELTATAIVANWTTLASNADKEKPYEQRVQEHWQTVQARLAAAQEAS